MNNDHLKIEFDELLETFPDGVIIVNTSDQILVVNKGFERMFGYDRAEVIGQPLAKILPNRLAQRHNIFESHQGHDQSGPQSHSVESFAFHKDGREVPVDTHLRPMATEGGSAAVLTLRDISKRRQNEAKIQFHANHDGLTRLPNRNLLEDRLGQSLLLAERFQQQVAVLCLDLDRFKSFLTGLGLDMGDVIVAIIADRLRDCVRESDTIARLGDDIFVIVLVNPNESGDTAKVAQKIQQEVARPIIVENRVYEISCSIGISIYPKDGKDVRLLLKNADIAMFRAKEKGGGSLQFFTDELNDRLASRMTMERCLRQALANNEFSLCYQPQMDLRTGRMTGCEALLRWQNPDLGTVSPATFIPLAEETGLIIPIGQWVLKTACLDNKRWQDSGYPGLPVAINLSPRQFWDPALVMHISRALHDSKLQAQYLELEITESMVMRDAENALAMLNQLKKLGVQLSIDDFGTGYSNLTHLKRFPFNKLKMDISFVREVTYDPGCAAIAKTIIALGHNLNLKVIAEGIETEGQLNYLRLRACDEMQGFYFSKPLTAESFENLLREGRKLHFPDSNKNHPRRSLLLIDDEPNIISFMLRALHDEGYQLFSATNAGDGFEILATNTISVVLSDIRMPGMDGIEFLSRVSRLHPETVRIAMSGYADMSMVTEAINRGAIYKFLNKPFAIEVLLGNIAKAFEQYEILLPYKQ